MIQCVPLPPAKDSGMRPHTEEPTFHKSSYSANESACVEVADLPSGAAVRDTRNRSLGVLAFPSSEWAALLSMTRSKG